MPVTTTRRLRYEFGELATRWPQWRETLARTSRDSTLADPYSHSKVSREAWSALSERWD